MTSLLSMALASELSGVFGALIDTTITQKPTDERPSGRCWVVTIVSDKPSHGTAVLRFDEVGAAALTALVMGLDETPPESSILDTLREALTQAISSTSFKENTDGVLLKVTKVELSDAPGGDEPDGFTFEAPGLAAPVVMSCGGNLDLEAAAAADAIAPNLGAGGGAAAEVMEALPERIDVILDIDLPLIVRFGRTELPLKTLARMGPGSLIDLGRSADDPVDVLVSNRVVARGEVVIVGGNYGVRILDVVSPKERIRSMEA